MTECTFRNDKYNDCGRAISNLERSSWNELLNVFQVQDAFSHQGSPRFSRSNGKLGHAWRLARLDMFYTPMGGGFDNWYSSYFIHRYSMGLDHSLVQNSRGIGNEDDKRISF